jgi:hypothetical protein
MRHVVCSTTEYGCGGRHSLHVAQVNNREVISISQSHSPAASMLHHPEFAYSDAHKASPSVRNVPMKVLGTLQNHPKIR